MLRFVFSMRSETEMLSLLLSLLCIAPILAQSHDDINEATVQNIYSTINCHESPCMNFWAYACGNWSSKYLDNFELAEESYTNAMAKVLQNTRQMERQRVQNLLNQMYDYFTACVRSENAEIQVPEDILSGHFEWTRATARLRKYGLNGVLFNEIADVAFNDSLRYVVQLRMPAAISNSSILCTLHEPHMDLCEMCWKHRNNENLLQSWTLGQLKQQIPQIDWHSYFKELLDMDPSDTDLRVEVSDVEYLRELGGFLQRSNSTSLEQYLRVHLANFAKEAYPSSRSVSKDHACIHHMRAVLPLGMNYIYDRYVYRTRSQDTRQLQDLFASLRRMLGKYLEWNRLELSSEQLHYVNAKLASMQLKLGNLPDAAMSDDFYDSHYASATFSRTDFQHNLWEALRLRTRLQHMPLLQRGESLQLNRYYVNDDVFRARNAPYFEHQRNTLIVPLIFMQFPFYDYRQHLVFRHSLMGFILAHEINHAFEQDGILFDASGNETPMGLHIREHPRFQAALKCFQQTPTASLKERLADVNGLQLAYDTFFGMGHDSQRFVYQPYTFEREFLAPQLFHLNFAQFFCGRLPPAIGHDMDDVRVNDAEKNLHQFSIDFKCRQMSRLKSCEMWRPATE